MCQTARRPSSRESEKQQQRSAQKKKGLGERLAETPEEPAEKECKTSSGQLARGERNKRRPSGGLSNPDHAQSQNARKMSQSWAEPRPTSLRKPTDSSGTSSQSLKSA